MVALVSISHVTNWYSVTNPMSWSIYLSIGVEIAALAALAAISAEMGSKVYFPFIVVTIIQFIGNIYYSYTYIDTNSKEFRDWIDLITPIAELFNIENTDIVGHKRVLSMLSGGMLPLISLSFLHMLVKFRSNKSEKIQDYVEDKTGEISELNEKIKKLENKLAQLTPTPTESEVTPTPTEPEITPTPTEPEATPVATPQEEVLVVQEIISEPDIVPDVTQPELEINEDDPSIPKIKRLSYTRRKNG